ncbi:MAG: CcoQ/FixQ family Cbb3-type cytochrome c oxidase assembly chaperone [Betaproteobacteria bacterium]
MEYLTPYLSATSSIIGLVAFLAIILWAWSPKQKSANQESAELPFSLPDEFSKDKS